MTTDRTPSAARSYRWRITHGWEGHRYFLTRRWRPRLRVLAEDNRALVAENDRLREIAKTLGWDGVTWPK